LILPYKEFLYNHVAKRSYTKKKKRYKVE
jgi:hypothetical protein